MISKTRMLGLVKGWQSKEIAAGLDENPALLDVRDSKGRNWLHVCCGVNPKTRQLRPSHGLATAQVLLDAGLDLDREAFREGAWQATPLWYATARGENLKMATLLLGLGADPNHCLWSAGFRDDVAAIKLLVAHGAEIDPVAEGHTPFLGAVQWSKFRAARALLELGANPDYRDAHGMTALHYMLKKGSDPTHVRMVVRYGARGDIANADGVTAADIMARKRAPGLRKLAAELGAG
ncbi:MAG: ankyrin repeat domain-containing protein [Deltaproteobacteria bacterium]|nr:ankyrin repeat domain-containing protein [Deltaproteobacteria bacterium]